MRADGPARAQDVVESIVPRPVPATTTSSTVRRAGRVDQPDVVTRLVAVDRTARRHLGVNRSERRPESEASP